MRIGHGYDVHRLVAGRPLILGGVEIPWEKGLLGHSDADVLTHAVMDALLGAAALGDIGALFPDSDPAYRGADSLKLLERVVALIGERGYRPGPGAQAEALYRCHEGQAGGGLRRGCGPDRDQGHHGGRAGLYRVGRGDGRPRDLPAEGARMTAMKGGGGLC